MLQELDPELQSGEQLRVCREVRIVLRAVQDACLEIFHEHLAEGNRRAGDVLGEGLAGPGGAGRGILTDGSTLKPLWVHASMLRASRSLMSERWRKKATMAARKYRASLARSRVEI